MAKVLKIVFGRPASDHLTIEIAGREFPDSTDYWDGNWLTTPISFDLGRFSGRLPADLRVDDIQRFRNELEAVYRDLKGEAELSSLDGWITTTVRCESRGQLRVTGVLVDQPGTGNRLKFSLDGLDQSFLPPILDELAAVLEAFPIRSEPNA